MTLRLNYAKWWAAITDWVLCSIASSAFLLEDLIRSHTRPRLVYVRPRGLIKASVIGIIARFSTTGDELSVKTKGRRPRISTASEFLSKHELCSHSLYKYLKFYYHKFTIRYFLIHKSFRSNFLIYTKVG